MENRLRDEICSRICPTMFHGEMRGRTGVAVIHHFNNADLSLRFWSATTTFDRTVFHRPVRRGYPARHYFVEHASWQRHDPNAKARAGEYISHGSIEGRIPQTVYLFPSTCPELAASETIIATLRAH
jgi:hypothetical protein